MTKLNPQQQQTRDRLSRVVRWNAWTRAAGNVATLKLRGCLVGLKLYAGPNQWELSVGRRLIERGMVADYATAQEAVMDAAAIWLTKN